MYEIGDYVTIKAEYDPECKPSDYRACFVSPMLTIYGGGSYKIVHKYKDYRTGVSFSVPDDGYLYSLENNGFVWASSMFEPRNIELI